MPDSALQRTNGHRSRAVPAMNCAIRTIGIALGLAIAIASQAFQPDASGALLRALAQDRKAARLEPLGTYSRVTRDVEPLSGASQAAIFEIMGPPDSCPWPTLEQCQRMRTWIYSFWPMRRDIVQDTSRGAGWSLILDVKDHRVWRAYWIAQ